MLHYFCLLDFDENFDWVLDYFLPTCLSVSFYCFSMVGIGKNNRGTKLLLVIFEYSIYSHCLIATKTWLLEFAIYTLWWFKTFASFNCTAAFHRDKYFDNLSLIFHSLNKTQRVIDLKSVVVKVEYILPLLLLGCPPLASSETLYSSSMVNMDRGVMMPSWDQFSRLDPDCKISEIQRLLPLVRNGHNINQVEIQHNLFWIET